MSQHSGITKPALQPEDIAMLHAVLRGWCRENSFEIRSPAAQHVARELVSWFECGIRNPHKLAGLMRHMHLDERGLPTSADASDVASRSAAKASQSACHHG
ncbi:hypothetical protein ABID08_005884 [Rhizobium binae]|uniref:Uncharacterized protein n=1 Tax=Rhizobium binae TaxID=1138190 RepID=A0ABV2MTA4_9HYPH|nr:hypothetical protein [Rhizobium binae]MBX4994451.1 hypothetical protein [Rhizobium binae]NKL51653.1 hypothetical protein [Rhizobium leguminosarum bv. viciae]QSY84905.1 hypothetical protein J2J99_23000 [Rhizobium binae]